MNDNRRFGDHSSGEEHSIPKSRQGRPSKGGQKAFSGHQISGGKKPYGNHTLANGQKPYREAKSANELSKSYGTHKTYHVSKTVDPKAAPYTKSSSAVKPTPTSRKERLHPITEVSPARKLALQVLIDVHKNDAYASLSLNAKLADGYISPEDKRLATALIYGVLENELRLDYILAGWMEHPASDPFARDILRIGVYQVLFMDRVPENAAVNEAVNQAKVSCPGSADMINGVLRNLCRGKDGIKYPSRDEEPVRWLSIMSSTPEWLVTRMIDSLGWEETEKLLMYRETNHALVLRPNMSRLSDAEFEQLLSRKAWDSEKALAPHAWKVSGASAISRDRDYLAGNFSIMGQSSIFAAEALALKPGMKVLDACAAPGGKSAYLCEKMQLTGRVYAWELHEKRAALIDSAKRRLGLENLRVMVRDATVLRSDDEETFDAVLLDAPCTGLGVLAQKPDIKLRLEESSIDEIVATQYRLLETVCRYVKRGGSFVYSTCSVLPEENCLQIHSFLERHPEFEQIQLPDSFPEELRREQTANGLQLMPHRDGVEGFFIANMRRRML